MLMHSNIPENQWNDVKGEIQKTWNKLNAAELEKTHGDVRAISSLVQKRYGLTSDVVDQKIDECIDRCGTAAGPASFRSSSASSAGPADLGSNVDPSSLSASINQTSSGNVHSRSFEAPEEGMDSAESLHASWNEGGDRVPDDFDLSRDSRMAEDVTTNEPKRYGSSEGPFNDSRSEAGQAGNSGRSQAFEGSAGISSRSETVSKSARNQEGSSVSRSQSRDRESDFAQNSRNSEDSSQEE
ncbi:hypothetical protein AZI86_12475 [Bdellovibrio bacteriovorus]|uniref:Uncharacterized protein n=1 Tax=Bdellovibrio bacteriovorus TaxID=959 RepID=A0A150WIV9_BDEBC|nr:CsbD family protein [Bdellovibrio bacteriovorus]KYG63640.1 hypothetical protein AZI86_12475 [Bdellovibrio bacteriovorus]